MKDLTEQIAAEFAELGGDRRPDYEDRLTYRRGATDRSKFAPRITVARGGESP
jgi:hypothetical protein